MQIITINSCLTIAVFDAFSSAVKHRLVTRHRDLGNKQDLCKIVLPGFDLVSFFGADISEWNIVKQNHHSLMSKLYDPLC